MSGDIESKICFITFDLLNYNIAKVNTQDVINLYKNILDNNYDIHYIMLSKLLSLIEDKFDKKWFDEIINISLEFINKFDESTNKQYYDLAKTLVIYGRVFDHKMISSNIMLLNKLNELLEYNVNNLNYDKITILTRILSDACINIVEYIDYDYDDTSEYENTILTKIWLKILNIVNVSLNTINKHWSTLDNIRNTLKQYKVGSKDYNVTVHQYNNFVNEYKYIHSVIFDLASMSTSAKLVYDKQSIQTICNIINAVKYYNPLLVNRKSLSYNIYYIGMLDECIGIIGERLVSSNVETITYEYHKFLLKHIIYYVNNLIEDINISQNINDEQATLIDKYISILKSITLSLNDVANKPNKELQEFSKQVMNQIMLCIGLNKSKSLPIHKQK